MVPLTLVLAALLLAVGAGLVFVSAAAAAPVTIVDDNGPDDQPGQKDLSFLTVDYGLPGATTINVQWGWDDTATTGANTRDGCALFDSDRDGNANFALCVCVNADGSLHRADVAVREQQPLALRRRHARAGGDLQRHGDDSPELGPVPEQPRP